MAWSLNKQTYEQAEMKTTINVTLLNTLQQATHILSALSDDASNGCLGHHHFRAQMHLILSSQPHLRLHFLKDVELGLSNGNDTSVPLGIFHDLSSVPLGISHDLSVPLSISHDLSSVPLGISHDFIISSTGHFPWLISPIRHFP